MNLNSFLRVIGFIGPKIKVLQTQISNLYQKLVFLKVLVQAGILSTRSSVIFSSSIFTLQELCRSTEQKQRSQPKVSTWTFWGRFREVGNICPQKYFQSGIDLDIHENTRKKNPSFKFRKIIILPCTYTKTWTSIARKVGFSSAMEGGAAEKFQPRPCKISYLFWINPTKCFPPS